MSIFLNMVSLPLLEFSDGTRRFRSRKTSVKSQYMSIQTAKIHSDSHRVKHLSYPRTCRLGPRNTSIQVVWVQWCSAGWNVVNHCS